MSESPERGTLFASLAKQGLVLAIADAEADSGNTELLDTFLLEQLSHNDADRLYDVARLLADRCLEMRP